MGVVGAYSLRFLAVFGTVSLFLAVKMTVLRFLSFSTISKFLTKYGSRRQIITKLKIKAMNNYPVRYDFVNIVKIFTFSDG